MIGIHNYEEYFLMYVDNELPAEERTMVEEFLELHPELSQELEMLKETVLPQEEAIFIPKTELLKLDSRLEEESLLLHLDNELEASLAASLEKEINANAETAKEWEILKKTKLDRNEKIEYPGKAFLYRREPARVVSMKFFRYAAAAIMIGAAIFLGIRITETGSSEQPQVIANEDIKPVITEGSKPSESLAEVKKGEQKIQNREQSVNDLQSEVTLAKKNDVAGTKKVNDPLSVPGKEKNDVRAVQPLRTEEMVIHRNEAPEMPRLASNEKPVTKPAEIIDRDMTSKPETYAMLASMEDKDDEEVLYMNEEKVSRSKVGRVFRKVKRVVERRTNINAPDALKIGGFEIALK